MKSIKSYTQDEKTKLLRNYMNEEVLDNDLNNDIAFNVFLLICPPKNFNDDFFNHEKVIYSSLLEFITITGSLKQEMIDFCGKLLGIYEACFRHCVPVKMDKQDTTISENFLKIFALLDFQRIAKLYEKYNAVFDGNKYADAYKVIYPFLRQFSFYESLITENKFGDESGK